MSLSRFAVQAPVKVSMIFFAVLLLGWISLSRLPTNLFPDIRAPKITITVSTRGLSPKEVEQRICEVIERSLYSIRGVIDVQSMARADSAVVVTHFAWDTDLDYAFLEVKKAASDLQRDRNDDIESINVLRYDPNATPIMTVALTAPERVDGETLYNMARHTLKPRFERLEGVANVVLAGGMEREVQVKLDETMLLSYGIDVASVVKALQDDNVDATGGWIEEGTRRYLLKAVGQFKELDEVKLVVVGKKGEAPVLLQDVGSVQYAPKEAKSLVYMDGKPAVGLSFYREAESNTVAVARHIREELEYSKKVLPESWDLVVANDQSTFISSAIREVRNNALMGGLLAIFILLCFLRDFRTTIIVAVSIPISIVATFNLMYFQGVSLNLMSLGGLALGCGMLVDNAIVVIENIFRLRQQGYDAKDSAMLGVQEVGGALIASTLTTVAVFLPIVFVKGVAGLLFKEQALTVAYSLLGSLVVALLLIPMLCAYFLGGANISSLSGKESYAVPRGLYTMTLRWALKLRVVVFIVALLLLYGAWQLMTQVPQEFLPSTDVKQVGIRLVLPNGSPIGATDRVVEAVTGQLDRYEEAIDRVYTRIGVQQGIANANTEDPDGPNTSDLFITLKDTDNPTTAMIEAGVAGFKSSNLIAGMKPILERIPDAKTEFRTSQGSLSELIGSSRAPLIIEISGQELDVLSRTAQEIQQRLESVDSLLNVRTNILDGAPEIRLKLDKTQLANYGLGVNGVATILRQRLDGEIATQIRKDAGDVDLRVEMDYGQEDLETLKNIVFKSPTGALVRVASIAEIEITRAPREIVRKRQERLAIVMADLAEGVKLSQGIKDAQAVVEGVTPPRYTLRFSGEEEQRKQAFGNLAFALILSIALVYMVMASIFESFLQPFLIMITIPLAFVGVIVSLIVTHQTINVMSIIGVVMLGGIVVNNAIVLLDCVNQVRSGSEKESQGLSNRETLLIGCSRRFRPVIMTSATTMLGLLPMALGLGDGAELRQAMAITVLGGLLTSTVLTLYVIPCAQSYLDSTKVLFRRLFHKPGVEENTTKTLETASDSQS